MSPQWVGAVAPVYRRRADVQVIVQGVDVTDRLRPFLLSVSVVDKRDEQDTCAIELDDRDAKMFLPYPGATVQVRMGWAGQGPRIPPAEGIEAATTAATEALSTELPWKSSGLRMVFQGYVDSVESGFSRRGGGRRLWIDCKGYNAYSVTKEPVMDSWGAGSTSDISESGGENKTLREVLDDVAKKYGLSLDMTGAEKLGETKRNFWFKNESLQHFVQRILAEVGGYAKLVGNKLIVREQTDTNRAPATIEAVWGINLISWRIKPYIGRPQWSQSKTNWFKILEHDFDNVKQTLGGALPYGFAQAIGSLPSMAPNQQTGEQFSQGFARSSRDNWAAGWCIINGEPTALAGNALLIRGARPGVDGRYLIREAEHIYTRQGGYTTRLDLMYPEPTAQYYKDMGWEQPTSPYGPTVQPRVPPEVTPWSWPEQEET